MNESIIIETTVPVPPSPVVRDITSSSKVTYAEDLQNSNPMDIPEDVKSLLDEFERRITAGESEEDLKDLIAKINELDK